MDKERVRAITEWQAPTKVKELKSFFGLANYYRRFIRGYSKKSSSAYRSVEKGPQPWSETCQAAFDDFKRAMTEDQVLKLPDQSLPFEVHTGKGRKYLRSEKFRR